MAAITHPSAISSPVRSTIENSQAVSAVEAPVVSESVSAGVISPENTLSSWSSPSVSSVSGSVLSGSVLGVGGQRQRRHADSIFRKTPFFCWTGACIAKTHRSSRETRHLDGGTFGGEEAVTWPAFACAVARVGPFGFGWAACAGSEAAR